MANRTYWMVALLMTASLQMAACAAKPPAVAAEKPSHVDSIDNSKLKKVTLIEKARTRLDIQTTAVLEEQVTRKRKVGGEVVASLGDSASMPADGSVWVRVNMTEGDLNQIDTGQTIRVLPLTSDSVESGMEAELEEGVVEDGEEAASSKSVYYAVRNKDHGLKPGQRMLVELSLKNDNKARKLIPYSSVIYDVEGGAWVYTNPEPLVYVRAPILIDYIAGEIAYLTEGPDAGAAVVSNGAAELYGAETGVGK